MFRQVLVSMRTLAMLSVSALAAQAPASDADASLQAPENRQRFSSRLTIVPSAQQTPLPIEVLNGHIVFKAKLAGRDATMLLDNGAQPSMIDLDFARVAGLEVEALEGSINTVHGAVPKRAVRGVAIELPGLATIDAGLMAGVDLAPIEQMAGRSIDGILGGDYLAQLLLIVSTSKGHMRLGPSGGAKVPPIIPRVALFGARPDLDLAIGETKVRVALDLGDNGLLSLTPEAWKRVAPADTKLGERMSVGGDGQPYRVKVGTLPVVTMGRFSRRDVPVRIIADDRPGVEGRVGIGFLADSDFLLDVKAGSMWIIPRARGTTKAGK